MDGEALPCGKGFPEKLVALAGFNPHLGNRSLFFGKLLLGVLLKSSLLFPRSLLFLSYGAMLKIIRNQKRQVRMTGPVSAISLALRLRKPPTRDQP